MKQNKVTLKGIIEAVHELFWFFLVNMLFFGAFRLVETMVPNCTIEKESGDLVCVGTLSPESQLRDTRGNVATYYSSSLQLKANR